LGAALTDSRVVPERLVSRHGVIQEGPSPGEVTGAQRRFPREEVDGSQPMLVVEPQR
jgi:hypothetical protein